MIPVISWKDLGSAAKQKGETDGTLKGCYRKRGQAVSSIASRRLDGVPPSGEQNSGTLQAPRLGCEKDFGALVIDNTQYKT